MWDKKKFDVPDPTKFWKPDTNIFKKLDPDPTLSYKLDPDRKR